MAFSQMIIFYLLLGMAVAAAVFLSGDAAGPAARAFQVLTAVLFWPIYLPLLLSGARNREDPPADEGEPDGGDEMSRAVACVEVELTRALSSLDGWAEDVLARERGRIEELRRAWRSQAGRIRDMDAVLAVEGAAPGSPPLSAGGDRRRHPEEARLRNIEQLREVRRRAHDDLMGTLAWVRELISMIHLARFTGAPASRAGELVAQIAASVEGLTEVSGWRRGPST